MRIPAIAFHGTLCALGLFYVAYTLDFGRGESHHYDWPLSLSSVRVLELAVAQRIMPFHAYFFKEDVLTSPLPPQTEFFARPHVILAPHLIPLVAAAGAKVAILFHVLINFTLGYFGLLGLCRHNGLDRLSFSMLYGVFFLSGFISTKLVVGHVFDVSYFLWPWFLLSAQRLLEGASAGRRLREMQGALIGLSLVLVYTLLQGSIHVLYIELMILASLFLIGRRARWVLAGVVALVMWGGAFRLFPILGFEHAYLEHPRLIWGGYGSWWGNENPCSVRSPTCWLSVLAEAAAVLRPITYHHDGCWWEFSLYIGLAGVVLVTVGLGFLLLKWKEALVLIAPQDRRGLGRSQAVLGLSGVLFFVLAMGPIYQRLFNPLGSHLQLFQVLTVPSRLMVHPFFLFACYAAAGWQVVRRARSRTKLAGAIQGLLVVLMIAACLEHATLWNIGAVERTVTLNDQTGWYPLHRPSLEAGLLDLPVSLGYRLTVYASLIASAIYLVAVGVYAAIRRLGVGKPTRGGHGR